MIIVDTLAINVRNPFWGTDSESFNPSRFKTIKQSDVSFPLYSFTPHTLSFMYKKASSD
jgi:hypothetical protein